MAKINPQTIAGQWKAGIALDVHTLSSTYLGVNEHGHEVYDTTRSEVGQLLYRLKYRSDMVAANEIVTTAAEYLKPENSTPAARAGPAIRYPCRTASHYARKGD